MTVPVLTAVADPAWESDLVTALTRSGAGLEVTRRCVDLADLLAAATAGLGRVVLLSADLRRLDREALTRLAVAGVAVVGVVAPGDESAERRLRQLGVTRVLRADAGAAQVRDAVTAAVGTASPAASYALADPRAVLPSPAPAPDDVEAGALPPGAGRVVAVWGPTGAPGRSSVALGLAAELADLGTGTVLVDADTYGGAQAQLLGVLDEAPGVAAACRLANNGVLDLPALAELTLEVRPRLRLLTGIGRPDRWTEVRPSGLDVVLGLLRSLAAVTVVDCGFSLERDEELSYDTAAPRRNGATLGALAAADTVVAVSAADPVGLQRFVRAHAELTELFPGTDVVPVVNRVRGTAVAAGRPEREIRAALARFAGIDDPRFVPLDLDGFDAAVAAGRTLAEAAPGSAAREPLRRLAAELAGLPAPSRRRRTLLRRQPERAALRE